MPTVEHVRALGEEVHRLRIAKGIDTTTELARLAGVSISHVAQIEKAYVNPSRGFTVPSDDVLDKLAKALDSPVSRFHALLGRLPDQPFPVLDDPKAMHIAEEYQRLPAYGQMIVEEALRVAKRVSEMVEPQSEVTDTPQDS